MIGAAAEAALAESTEQNPVMTVAGVDLQLWRQLFLQSPTPLLVLKGPDHRFEMVNEAYVHLMLRQSTDELVGRPISEAIPELAVHGVFDVLDTVYATGVAHLGREERRTLVNSATGIRQDAYFDVVYKPILGEDGRPVGIMIQGNDVTEHVVARKRSQAREAMLTNEWAKLAEMYRTAPVGFAMYDPVEFRLLRANDKFSDMLGVPIEQVLGKTVFEIAGNTAGVRERYEFVANGGRMDNVIVEGELRSSPDELHVWLVNYAPLLDADGKVRAITTISLDITAQKRAEQALLQSEKLAAVGRLASSIAHEINNPLEAVTNLLYLAQHSVRGSKAAQYLDLADRELRRVSAIANQTLRFYKQQTAPIALGARELMAWTLGIYEGRLRNSEISVEQQIRTDEQVLCMDGEIRQVLSSMVDNAIDSMPLGGRLILRSRKGTDWRNGRRGLIFTVADDGSGMDGGTRAKAFEPFYTTKGAKGTGLGLWISQEIMQRHDGSILLRSSTAPEHHGTVLSIFLPFVGESPASVCEEAAVEKA